MLRFFLISAFLAAALCASHEARAFNPDEVPATAAKMRQAVRELEALLAANHGVADTWRSYLELKEIHAQLDLGPDADPARLAPILARFTAEAEGLERPQLQRFKTALTNWHAALAVPNPSELWQQAEAEAAAFKAVSPAEVETQRRHCLDRLQAVEHLLATQGENGAGWKKQLKLTAIITAVTTRDWQKLPRETGNIWRAATAIWPSPTLIAAHQSLQQYEVARVRSETQETVESYRERLTNLAETYRLWREQATPERQSQLSSLVHELEIRGQAKSLTSAIRCEHSRPNLVVRVSAPFIAKHTKRPVVNSFPVNDTIGGRPISGNASVQGEAFLQVVPSETAANLDIQLTAEMFSETSAFSRGVQVDTIGTTHLLGRKQLFIDSLGMRHTPADVSASSQVSLQGIYGGQLRRWIAERVYYRQEDQARAESEAKAAHRTAEQMDREVTSLKDKLATGSAKKYMAPLFSTASAMGRSWRTNSAAIEGRFWAAQPEEFAATSVAPGIELGQGVAFQVHESFLERSMRESLGGKKLQSEGLERELSQLFMKINPQAEEIESDQDWSVTFAKEPVRVDFADDVIQMTMLIESFESDRGNFPGIQITSQYAVICERPDLILQRAGPVEVYPIDYRSDSSATFSGRQQVLRRFVERQFDSHLRRNVVLPGLKATEKNGLKEPLDFVESRVADGWMSLLMEAPQSTQR